MPRRASVLWTGGKDSSLAFHEAQLAGFEIDSLITFVPTNPVFLAHPLDFMKHQAEAIDLPHKLIEIKEPYKESYKEAFRSLKEEQGVDTVVTGDIDEVDGLPNWVMECGKSADINVETPLWKMERAEVLKRLIQNQFKVIFSCVKNPWFTKDWIGKEITPQQVSRLDELNQTKGADICGENGEYHTLVCDGPFFQKRISIDSFSASQKDDLMYINIQKLSFKDRLM